MIGSLKDVEKINGKYICVMDDLKKNYPEMFNESGSMNYELFEKNIRPNFNIFLRHDVDSLTFNMLTKPASEGGDLNRCQFVDLIHAARVILSYLDNKFPCKENKETLNHLDMAIRFQEERTKDRKQRDVEGQNKL